MFHSIYNNTPYIFNVLAIQTLVVALGIIILGIYALIREQGSTVSVVYFVLTLSMGVWLFGFSWMYSAIDVSLAMWWAKVAYVGIAFIPAAVFHFSALVVQEYDRVRKRVLTIWVISACFITLIITTDIQFSSLYHYSWGYYPRSSITSIPFILFFFGIMLSALRNFVSAFHRAKKGSGQKVRARILLTAFAAGYFGAADFIASFGISWFPLGYVGIFLFTVISTRSILRYRFGAITPAFAAHQIIDTMNDALIVLDPDGIVKLVNEATCKLFGYHEIDLVGKRLAQGMPANTVFTERFEAVIGRGTVHNYEVEYQSKEGAVRALAVSTSTMMNPAGNPLATVCVVNDITDRRRSEQEREKFIEQLKDANQKLQAVDKMKSDIVSVVSHELRTPLTTIKAFIELIIMKPDMPVNKRAHLMDTINAETDRLSRLISDLLDLARIEAGSIKWRVDEVSVEDVVRSSISAMGPMFENKRLQVTTIFEAPRIMLFGDRDRLLQVVTNLLSNAVKFTAEGGAIQVTVRKESLPSAHINVAISDTGIGIPATDLELIFEKFQRSGDQRADSIEGTGLGLAISRQIIEHHGGRIWATSTYGKGSTFTFTLPLPGTGT